jgi:UTP--glucose-1-phosphate uridylyltransferase
MDIEREKTSHYGVLDIEKKDGKLIKAKGLVEKPRPEKAPSTIAICGRYILQPGIFDYLEKQQRGAGGEIQLTDAMHALAQSEEVRGYLYEGQRYDCGSRLGYLEANIAYALQHDDMRERVTEMLQQFCKTE